MKISIIKRISMILAIITLFSLLTGCADNNTSDKYNPTDSYDSSDKNDDSAEYDFSGINYFSYRYCSGMADHLGVSFKLELKDEVYTATVKPKDELFSKSKEFIVDKAFVEELTKLLEKTMYKTGTALIRTTITTLLTEAGLILKLKPTMKML